MGFNSAFKGLTYKVASRWLYSKLHETVRFSTGWNFM